MARLTQAQLIRLANRRFSRSGFTVEKIRVFYENTREVNFDIYIDGIANQVSGSFHRTSKERNVKLSETIPSWLQIKINRFLKAICDRLSDLLIYDELLAWNRIPEK